MKIVLILMVIMMNCFSQDRKIHFEDIDKSKLPNAVKKLLKNTSESLDELKPSIPKGELPEEETSTNSKFNFHTKSYEINKSLDEVWEKYTNVNPAEAWDTPSSKFAMGYNKCKNEVYYSDSDNMPDRVEENNIFFLKLTFLGVLNIPVAFEITDVDPVAKKIEFTYLENNKSNGRQTLYFSESNGKTIIKHDTIFSSGSEFRDKNLYPHFHTVALDDFHHRMRDLIEEN